VPPQGGPFLAPPVMGASLIVAEVDGAALGDAPIRLHVGGIDPPPEAVAHER
jgi:hypothetical protein